MAHEDVLTVTGAPRPSDESKRSPSARTTVVPDIHRWALEQAAHLRAGRFHLVDRSTVADEVEDVGRREYDAVVSDLTVVLLHLLKWDHEPERRSRSWALSVREHRRRVTRRLADSPSLRGRQDGIRMAAYDDARDRASAETDMPLATFPETCPYTWAEAIDHPILVDPE